MMCQIAYHQTPSYLLMIFLFFFVTKNYCFSASNLNNDLVKLTGWAFQWTMNLNADQTKLIFGKKTQQQNHPNLYVNQHPVLEVNSQKHLRIFLDKQLDFKEHFSNISDKVNKVIGDLRKLRCIQPTFFFADNLQFVYGTPSLLKRCRS